MHLFPETLMGKHQWFIPTTNNVNMYAQKKRCRLNNYRKKLFIHIYVEKSVLIKLLLFFVGGNKQAQKEYLIGSIHNKGH